MRTVAFLLVIVALGCMRPQRKRFTSPLASVGQRLVAVVKSGAIKIDANAAIQAAAKPPPAQRVQEEPPPQPAPQPRDSPSPAQPDIQVTRVDAARPTVFVLRGRTQAGKDICEQFTTQDACNTACTAKWKPHMLEKPGPDSVTSCACNEQDTGC